MTFDEIGYSIKIFDRNGAPYRDYTPSSLKKLFLESRTAANFELLATIEGLTFLGYFLYCNINDMSEQYEKDLEDHVKGRFSSVINKLYDLGIIDKELQSLLHEYRTKRNVVMHNWLRMKTPLDPGLTEYSHDEALGDLFMTGMKVLGLLHLSVSPRRDNWDEYQSRFKGFRKRKA